MLSFRINRPAGLSTFSSSFVPISGNCSSYLNQKALGMLAGGQCSVPFSLAWFDPVPSVKPSGIGISPGARRPAQQGQCLLATSWPCWAHRAKAYAQSTKAPCFSSCSFSFVMSSIRTGLCAKCPACRPEYPAREGSGSCRSAIQACRVI